MQINNPTLMERLLKIKLIYHYYDYFARWCGG